MIENKKEKEVEDDGNQENESGGRRPPNFQSILFDRLKLTFRLRNNTECKILVRCILQFVSV